MSINSVSQAGFSAYAASTTITKEKDSVKTESVAVSVSVSQTVVSSDSYVPAQETAAQDAVTGYAPPKKLSSDQVEALERQLYESMKALAEKMLSKQAEKANYASMSFDELASALGMGTTPETAAAAISEDGMWGVNAVSTRLMDMAMSLSKGDPAMAEELRAAVQKGFEAVGALETLPQVCQDTYAETMARFDYWIANGSLDGYGEAAEETEGAAEGSVSYSESVSVVASETIIEA